MPKPKTTTKKISDYTLDPDNINQGSEFGTALLEKSIQEVGLARSAVADKNGMMIAGNKTLEKAGELGFTEVIEVETTGQQLVVVKRMDLDITTPMGIRAKILDNTVSKHNYVENAEIAQAMCQLADLDGDKYGLKVQNLTAKDDEFEIPETITTDIKEGELFEIGEHRLICGDARRPAHISKLLKGEQIDLIVTDPPYNVDYHGTAKEAPSETIMNDNMSDSKFYEFLLQFYKSFLPVTKPGGAIYVFHADSEGLNFRRAFVDSGFLLKQCLIWVKNSITIGRQDYQWRHEPILYGWKPGAAHYFTEDRSIGTVIEDQADFRKMTKAELVDILETINSDKVNSTIMYANKPTKNDLHPTMKPVTLIARQILNSSKPGAIVADGFGGSGTTMIGCEQLERKCRMMDLDPKYCQVIIDRMIKFNPAIKVLRNGKPYKPKPIE